MACSLLRVKLLASESFYFSSFYSDYCSSGLRRIIFPLAKRNYSLIGVLSQSLVMPVLPDWKQQKLLLFCSFSFISSDIVSNIQSLFKILLLREKFTFEMRSQTSWKKPFLFPLALLFSDAFIILGFFILIRTSISSLMLYSY